MIGVEAENASGVAWSHWCWSSKEESSSVPSKFRHSRVRSKMCWSLSSSARWALTGHERNHHQRYLMCPLGWLLPYWCWRKTGTTRYQMRSNVPWGHSYAVILRWYRMESPSTSARILGSVYRGTQNARTHSLGRVLTKLNEKKWFSEKKIIKCFASKSDLVLKKRS